MVGSMSFSSGARISVISCFAVQSIAAPCLGYQQNSCWNGRQTEVDSPTMMVKTQHHAIDFARGISTGCSSTGHISTVQRSLFFHFSQLSALVITIPVFSLESACKLLCPCALQQAAGSHLSFSLQVGVSDHSHLLVVCPLYHQYFFNLYEYSLLYCCFLCCYVASCYKPCFFFLLPLAPT